MDNTNTNNKKINSIQTLQYIQQKVREIKQVNPTIKHRTAVALVSEEYRKEYGTIRKVTKNKKLKQPKNNNANKKVLQQIQQEITEIKQVLTDNFATDM